jgi:anti-sigma regulatory factor (Ser/Thr protein kinase)
MIAYLLSNSEGGAARRSRQIVTDLEPGSDPASAIGADVTGVAWPLQSYLEFGALPSAVPCARLHTRQVAWEWGLGELSASVELIVSELVTNAQRASAGITGSRYRGQWRPGVPPIRLWLGSDNQRVLVQVWDGDHHLPEPQAAGLEAESGRGLLLVDSLSQEWGASTPEGSSGKIVWALISVQ